jgi:hypothetical protein
VIPSHEIETSLVENDNPSSSRMSGESTGVVVCYGDAGDDGLQYSILDIPKVNKGIVRKNLEINYLSAQ